MKKLILAAALIFTISLSACTKENVQPTKSNALNDKANLAQCDYSDPNSPCNTPPDTNPPPTGGGISNGGH